MRRFGVPLVVAVLLIGCAAPGAQPEAPLVGGARGSQAPPASVPPAECPPSGVLIRTGPVDAAMGLRAMGVELVNCGTDQYSVNGYPGVRVLDEAGEPLDVTVVQGSSAVALIDGFDTAPAPVTAGPGERLAAGLVWRNTVADSVLEPTNGTYLEIVPAPGQPPQVVRPEGRVDLGTTGRLGVTAWARR